MHARIEPFYVNLHRETRLVFMQLNFTTCVSFGFSAFVGSLLIAYVCCIQPLLRFWPKSLRYLGNAYYARLVQITFSTVFSHGFKISTYGHSIDPKESAIIFLNHQSLLDYLLVFAIAKELNPELNVFFFIDKRVVKFPTIRTILYRYRGKTNWSITPRSLDKAFDEVHRIKQSPKWIVVFPEVNVFTPQLNRTEQVTCHMAGAPPLKHLLYPRYSSALQCVEYLRTATVTAVYDLTVEYAKNTDPYRLQVPSLAEALGSNHEWNATIWVKREGIAKIPKGRRRLEKWLEKKWYKKDDLLEKHARQGAKL